MWKRSAIYFNSQPHEEADGRKCCASTMNTHFNSQPHEEADNSQSCTPFSCGSISTHSLTRRLTVHYLNLILVVSHFNSQPHEEADDGQSIDADIVSISTHSLTRRLTEYSSVVHIYRLTFQLTASRGGWRFPMSAFTPRMIFQLTASRGGWPD